MKHIYILIFIVLIPLAAFCSDSLKFHFLKNISIDLEDRIERGHYYTNNDALVHNHINHWPTITVSWNQPFFSIFYKRSFYANFIAKDPYLDLSDSGTGISLAAGFI